LKYNKIYFLHIPKTGGRYISHNIIDPIKDQLNENGIEQILEHNAHTGWHSRIDDKTYVISALRDPAEQLVSLYSHSISLNNEGNLKNEYDKNKINKKEFFEWLKNEKSYTNFQTKNFLLDEFYFKKDHPKNKLNVKLNIDEKILKIRKNRVNLFLDMKNINNRELEIQKKIFLDLGINAETRSFPKKTGLCNPESKNLYSTLTEKEKIFIRESNLIDNNLYINNNYF
jgi:hypothetical protein